MKRKIEIKADNGETKISIVATVDSNCLCRSEVILLVESLREGLVDLLRNGVCKFGIDLKEMKF